MAVYTTIDDPAEYFETLIWTGDGNTPRSLTGLDFQPNMIWSKRRDDAAGHNLLDSVRGAGANAELCPSSAGIEGANAAETYGYLSAFTSDGFTVTEGSSDNAYWNNSSATYVAWNWKESATAGFDIVSYTGNGSARTISHSLSAVPKFIIVKNRESAENWRLYHAGIASDAETDEIYLDLNYAPVDTDSAWNDTAPTSSVFSVGTNHGVNKDTEGHIAYLFADVQGFSKFGKYTGNGNVDAPFLFCGFRPAFLMIKRTDTTSNWVIFDNKRGSYNEINNSLYPNSTGAEDTDTSLDDVDFVSNGVKIREDSPNINADGGTYVFMAFVEAPFVNSNGVPCNAR